MRKKIGLVGHWVGENSFGITRAYITFWSYFGDVQLITPFDSEVRELDLLVLPGGPDVDVFRYLGPNDDIHQYTGQPRMEAERFDKMLLPKYIENKTPIFGTCRGHQSLAVFFGAKLNQHMYHETNGKDPGEEVHELAFENLNVVPGLQEYVNSLNHKERNDYGINSRHHQTVNEETLPNEATIIGRYKGKFKNDKSIEALTYWPYYPAHTTQWHCEDTWDNYSITLIKHLLSLSDEKEV